jgi:16S rRNA A1518/A1519 N6-dimethyltransferase RsmA/KsgA/DIM1 with predicted DNA glycosylase/AP lyase activity
VHEFWAITWAIAIFVFVAFSFVVFFGAPFLPTLTPQVANALDMIDLEPGQTLLELGSGDGKVMIAAAERGLTVIGYELNPLLVVYSWLRTRKYKGRVKVVWGNFWRKKLPQTDGIFVFLLQPYMQKLDNKITQEYSETVKLVSFAFHIPDRKPARQQKGVYLYTYQ